MSSAAFVSRPGANRALAGIGFMLAGMFVFSLNDVMGKWLVATYSVGQLLLIRSAAALVALAPLIGRAGWRNVVHLPRPGLQILRVVFSTLEVALFYWAVVDLPLADAVTFYLAGPVYVTLAAGPILGEKVGWRRWLAVLVGFAGVVIAVGPTGAALSSAHAVALLGSILFAGLNVVTRMLAGSNETGLVTWQAIGALVFGAITAPFGWVMPSLVDFLLLGLLGIVATVAHMCVNRSLAYAPAAVVVPYQYTLIVFATVLGFIFFGDWPAPHVFLGAALIVAAGLFIFFREQLRARERAAPSSG